MAETERRFVVEPGALWPSAHAASAVELPDGRLLASWFAGSREGAPDSAIWTAAFDGAVWSEARKIIDTPNQSDGNSVLWLDGAGVLRIWYVTMEGRGWASCPVRERRSQDGGETWSEPASVHEERGWMVRNEPVRWQGKLVMPMYDERDWTSFVLISEDGGETWTESKRLRAKVGLIQPALAELYDGRLLMFLRTTAGVIDRSVSEDGSHWSKAEPAGLPNPNSAIELIRIRSGALLTVYNPTDRGRTPLRVARSDDNGATWHAWRDLETEPGEYSYPTAVQTRDGAVHVLYTWRRETIAHAVFDEEWVSLRN